MKKKLLILSFIIFCFYGCKTGSSESNVFWGHPEEDFMTKEYYAIGLWGSIHSNICDKNIYSLKFNGNSYSKMDIVYKITETNTSNKKTKNSLVIETLEENNDLITLTISHNDGRTTHTLFNTKKQEVTINNKSVPFHKYCEVIKADIFLRSAQGGIIEVDSIPSQTFTISGKTFSTTYSKIKEPNDKFSQESWIATNDELKDIAIQQRNTKQPAITTTTVTNFSFIKK